MDLLLALAAAALLGWTAWLIRRTQLPRWWYVPAIVVAIGLPSMAWVTAALLVRTFTVAPRVGAADRQAALAHGISAAMWPTAAALAVALLWLLALAIATARLRRRFRT